MGNGSLIAPVARRAARRLVAGCAALAVLLGLVFFHGTTPDAVDRVIDSSIITRLSSHQNFMFDITRLGTLGPAAAISLALALFSRRLNGAVLSITAVLAATVVCDYVFKPVVHRTYYGHLAYPSGHTCAVTAMTTVLVILVCRPGVRNQWRVLSLVISLLAIVAIALAVITLRWHYFTDTIAGFAIGAGTVVALALLIDRIPALSGHRPPK
jgi:membrane-associated phospholipid phosphatase